MYSKCKMKLKWAKYNRKYSSALKSSQWNSDILIEDKTSSCDNMLSTTIISVTRYLRFGNGWNRYNLFICKCIYLLIFNYQNLIICFNTNNNCKSLIANQIKFLLWLQAPPKILFIYMMSHPKHNCISFL